MYNSLNLYKSECYFHLFTFKMESFLQYIVLSFFDVHMLPLHIFFFSKTYDWYYKNNWYTIKKKLTRIYNIIKFVKNLLL